MMIATKTMAGGWRADCFRNPAAVNECNTQGITLQGVRQGLELARQALVVTPPHALPSPSPLPLQATSAPDATTRGALYIQPGDDERAVRIRAAPRAWLGSEELRDAVVRWAVAEYCGPDGTTRVRSRALLKRALDCRRGRPPVCTLDPEVLLSAEYSICEYLGGLKTCIKTHGVEGARRHFPDCEEALGYLGRSLEDEASGKFKSMNTLGNAYEILGRFVNLRRSQLFATMARARRLQEGATRREGWAGP